MLSSSLDALSNLSKTTSPQVLFDYDCMTLYVTWSVKETTFSPVKTILASSIFFYLRLPRVNLKGEMVGKFDGRRWYIVFPFHVFLQTCGTLWGDCKHSRVFLSSYFLEVSINVLKYVYSVQCTNIYMKKYSDFCE